LAALQSLNFKYNQTSFAFMEIAKEISDIFMKACRHKDISLKLDIIDTQIPIYSDKSRIL